MPRTLEDIRGDLESATTAYEAAAAVVNDPARTATDADLAAFRTAEETFSRVRTEAEGVEREQTATAERTSRNANVTSAREFNDRFRAAGLRLPNQGGPNDPGRDTGSGKLTRWTQADAAEAVENAFTAWLLAPTEHRAHVERFQWEAAERIGVNPMSHQFAPNLFSRRQYETFLRAWAGEQYNTNYMGPAYRAALAAPDNTPYLDSRVPDGAGLLNQPPTYLSDLERNIVTYGGVLSAPITIRNAPGFEDIEQTFADDQIEGRQIGEGRPIGVPRNPNFNALSWKAWDFTSDDVIVTERQLGMARWSIPSFVSDIQGERLGRIFAKKFTWAKGVGEPLGLVEAVKRGGKVATTAANNALTNADLVALEYALDEAFKSGPGVGYMMHPTTLQMLELVVDLNGKPYFELGQETATNRRTLRRKPIFLNYQMPVWAAAAQAVILFGNFPAYEVVRRGTGQPRLIRDDTTLRRELKVIFTTIATVDANLRNYGNCPLSYLNVHA